jgi:hypothetical protein
MIQILITQSISTLDHNQSTIKLVISFKYDGPTNERILLKIAQIIAIEKSGKYFLKYMKMSFIAFFGFLTVLLEGST